MLTSTVHQFKRVYTKLGKEGSEVMRKSWIRKIHKNLWIADKGILE